MADANTVLTCLRQELVTLGLVRRPAVTGPLPPCHVEPIDGAPAPGEREAPENNDTLVVTLAVSSELGESQFDSYRRRLVINVSYRGKGTAGLKAARVLDDAIRHALALRVDYGLGWTMGAGAPAPDAAGVLVLSSSIYGGLGPVSRDPAAGYHDVAKYLIEVAA